ncbi:Aspartokinase [Hondaea fermentalgiana]|uniref:aspartate kinase n=1 Tax=Hondaea fermentalgiana TaxID=2315210 RepID=A0A2R5GRR8_9STRA|nr:Aspartokinase [Hondaea fermentalgiana]|eukprot:GBG33572.1 Aspartokinase [Hondaea fermentalgiana]
MASETATAGDGGAGSGRWVVCKFGGTSVSSAETWGVIVKRVKDLRKDGKRVCLVLSAVSQTTNHLVALAAGLEAEAVAGGTLSPSKQFKTNAMKMRAIASNPSVATMAQQAETGMAPANIVEKELTWLCERHQKHCEELGVEFSCVEPYLEELKRLVNGIRLTGESTSSRLRARILGYGELMSSTIGVEFVRRAMEEEGEAEYTDIIDARDVLVTTARNSNGGDGAVEDPSNKYLNADVIPFCLDPETTGSTNAVPADLERGSRGSYASSGLDRRALLFADKRVVVTQGFIASTPEGQACVLGRGGSDTSGALFAAALAAEKLEIWTDVNGMFSSDPRQVKNARLIEELTYREAQELAAMGAKVLHPRCLGPASFGRIPVEIRNTMKPDSEHHTRILRSDLIPHSKESAVMAITKRSGQVLLTITSVDMWGEAGFLSRVFAPFQHLGISVDLIATSQYAVSMTLEDIPGGTRGQAFSALIRSLDRQGDVTVKEDCTVVSIVGRKLRALLHGMADAFKELEQYNLLLLSESTEDLNMSFVIGEDSKEAIDQLVSKLHYVLLERPNNLSPPGPRPVSAIELGAAAAGVPRDIQLHKRNSSGGSSTAVPAAGKTRAASFSSTQYWQLPAQAVASSRSTDLSLGSSAIWLEAEVARHQSLARPFSIIDLESVRRAAANLSVYPLSWSEQPAVLRTVLAENPGVTFMCRSAAQVMNLCSIVGTQIQVFLLSGAGEDVPSGVTLVSQAPVEEAIVKAQSVLGGARVVVANIIKEAAPMATIDVWFSTRVANQRVHVVSGLDAGIKRVQALQVDQEILDSILVFNDEEAEVSSEGLISTPGRIALVGVPSTPFDTQTRQPVAEFVRFA